MADWVYEADWLTIHKHVDAWNITGIADFHKEVLKYRDNAWGLGGCTQNRNGEARAVENESSKYYHQCFVCEPRTSEDEWVTDNYTWHANDDVMVCETYGLGDIEIGEVITGVVSGKKYIYTGKKWVYVKDSVVVDERDNQKYRTVAIGEQVWMAENLNYDYNEGTAKSYCYNNSADSCAKYGRLYTWAAAMDSAAVFSDDGKGCGYGKVCSPSGRVRGVCPEGWHLPSNDEWEELFATVGGREVAGKILKAKTGWNGDGNGTDAYGFSALPAGYRDYGGGFSYVGDNAFFWSSSEYDSNNAYGMYLYYSDEHANLDYNVKNYADSVRCFQDSN